MLSWHCDMKAHVSKGTKAQAVPLSTTACHESTSGPHGTGAIDGLLKLGDLENKSRHSSPTKSHPEICLQKVCETYEQLTPLSTTFCHFSISSKVRISTKSSTRSFSSAHSSHVALTEARSASRSLTRVCKPLICSAHSAFAAATAAVTLASHASRQTSSE